MLSVNKRKEIVAPNICGDFQTCGNDDDSEVVHNIEQKYHPTMVKRQILLPVSILPDL